MRISTRGRSVLRLVALLTVLFHGGTAPAADPPATDLTRWVEFPIPAKFEPPAKLPATPAELVAAMRNEDLIWEIQFPVPEHNRDKFWWIGPHFSPRGRHGTATYALMPFPPVWAEGNGLGTWDPIAPSRTPPYRLREIAEPLLTALNDPKRWVAAHVILTHLVLRGEPDGKSAATLRKSIDWPQDEIIPGNLLWVIQRRKDLKLRDDGWYEDAFIQLRVELRPEGKERSYTEEGTPGGVWTVREAAARIDASQQERIRAVWAERLHLAADAAKGQAGDFERHIRNLAATATPGESKAAWDQLKSWGRGAFPALIAHFGDKAVAAEAFQQASTKPTTVGEACFDLLQQQVEEAWPKSVRDFHVLTQENTAAWLEARRGKAMYELRRDAARESLARAEKALAADPSNETLRQSVLFLKERVEEIEAGR